ncbi:MAG: rRNA maturation RNase YbeY [Eubacteriales bacterium]|nr:rRNA maturation RNase YbeY [Eubacteriales bacterium]
MIILNIENKNNTWCDFSLEKVSNSVINEALKLHKISVPCFVNLIFCTKKKIKEVNNSTRNINKVTDVLSFPNIDFNISKYDISIYDFEHNAIYLGDILICTKKMIEQAKKYNHSIKRECAFLIAHSILHLLGYDHIKKDDEEKMFTLQERILNNIGISR